jgi:hypothetical protein
VVARALVGGGATPDDLIVGSPVTLGLLAAVAYYAVGIKLLQVQVTVERFNEAAVFAFAALAALQGLRLGRAAREAEPPG